MNKPVLIGAAVVVAVLIALPILMSLAGKEAAPPPTEPEIDIWTAASQGAVNIVQQHIAYGTDINGVYTVVGVPGAGGSPLHIACLTSQTEIINVLVDAGAAIEQKAVPPDIGGGTPLHWAVFALNESSTQAMLDAGANANAVDKNGTTVLDYAFVDFGTGRVFTSPAEMSGARKRIHDVIAKAGGKNRDR